MGKMCCLLLLTQWCQDSMFARSVTIRCSRLRQSSSMRRPGRHFSRLWGRIHFRKDKNHPTPIRYSKTHLTDYRLHPNPRMNRKLAYKYDPNDTIESAFCTYFPLIKLDYEHAQHSISIPLQVSCGKCGNGLGHEFLGEGPKGKGSRFWIFSHSLKFVPKGKYKIFHVVCCAVPLSCFFTSRAEAWSEDAFVKVLVSQLAFKETFVYFFVPSTL